MPAHRSIPSLLAGAGFALLPLADALAAGDPTGVWINDTGRGAIEIRPCGAALCGHVVWVKDPTDTKGCGRQIIGNAAKVGANTWDNGWIYSPEKKKRYDVELKPMGGGKLQVTGYAGTKIFSKTMIWTRAPANLARCGQNETIAKADPKKPETKAKADTKSAVASKTEKAETKSKVAAKSETSKSEPPKSEAKIVTPAPKPADRPAAKPAAEPPTQVARIEPEVTAPAAPPAAPSPAQPAAPETANTAPDAGTEAAAAPAATSPVEPTNPAATTAPAADHPVPGPVEPEVAEEETAPKAKGLDMGPIAKRLAELERETGYGLKKSGNGNCRLKVPFATVNFPCKD